MANFPPRGRQANNVPSFLPPSDRLKPLVGPLPPSCLGQSLSPLFRPGTNKGSLPPSLLPSTPDGTREGADRNGRGEGEGKKLDIKRRITVISRGGGEKGVGESLFAPLLLFSG